MNVIIFLMIIRYVLILFSITVFTILSSRVICSPIVPQKAQKTLFFEDFLYKNTKKADFMHCFLHKNPLLVGRGGFEPPKSKTSDLQSDPFGHSGICPCRIV